MRAGHRHRRRAGAGTLGCLLGLGHEPLSAGFFNPIVPATGLGVLGLVAMAGMARNARTLSRASGAAPVPERAQTGALALACLLPFTVGLAWFAWNVYLFHQYPPSPNGFPFGPVADDELWKLAVLFGEGPMAALGGPLLGVLIGRWFPRRGIAPLCAVLLVSLVVVFQGYVEPVRSIRLFSPWTYFGGPAGVEGDPDRMVLYPGSPQWWVVYTAVLCGLAVVGALWHDPEARTTKLRVIGAVLILAAVATYGLATFTGIDHTVVNPLSNR